MSPKELYELQQGLCVYCGQKMRNAPAKPLGYKKFDSGYTRDHVVPKSRGGTSVGNIVLVHQWCNNKKSNKMPTNLQKRLRDHLASGKPLKTMKQRRGWNGKVRFA